MVTKVMDKKSLQRLIIGARRDKSWSQPQLALVAGLSIKTITRVETATANPSTDTLRRLAKALDLDVRELI